MKIPNLGRFIGLGIFFLLLCIVYQQASKQASKQANLINKDKIVVHENAFVVSSTEYNKYHFLYTIKHDNHLFVLESQVGILHHPDCHCLKKLEKP